MATDRFVLYNQKTDSVDIVFNSYLTLRLFCQTIFPLISTTPKTYELMVKLSREDPATFADKVLDHCLEEYLESQL